MKQTIILLIVVVLIDQGRAMEGPMHYFDDDTHDKICKRDFIKDEHLDKIVNCEKEFKGMNAKLEEEVSLSWSFSLLYQSICAQYESSQKQCLEKFKNKLDKFTGVKNKEGHRVISYACFHNDYFSCLDEHTKVFYESHLKLRVNLLLFIRKLSTW